jgi:hypothetical protein
MIDAAKRKWQAEGSQNRLLDVRDTHDRKLGYGLKLLAESGQICEVMGHQWGDSMKVVFQNQNATRTSAITRTCGLCGLKQKQQYIQGHWSEWEEVKP